MWEFARTGFAKSYFYHNKHIQKKKKKKQHNEIIDQKYSKYLSWIVFEDSSDYV